MNASSDLHTITRDKVYRGLARRYRKEKIFRLFGLISVLFGIACVAVLFTDIFSKGDFFGFNAIIEDRNYSDNADTLEETDLMLIPREEFLSLFTNDAQVSKHFIKLITKNVFEKEEALINLAYNSLRKKVAFGLIRVLEKYRNEKADNSISELSRENLAQLIGVATESLIRTLADFKSEGLINLEPSKIIIINEKKLRDLPC